MPGKYIYFPVATLSNLQQEMHCVFVDISEGVVLLSRHKIDVKEDITL